MTAYRFLFLSFLLLLSIHSTWADQLIIEPDMGRKPIIKMINDAHYSLNLVMYGFTDKQLLQPIVEQKLKSKTVKIILEQHPYKAKNENNKTIKVLNKNRIDWHGFVTPFHLIHQKTLITDGNKALVMTFNFTRSSFKNQRNFGLIIDDPQRVKTIQSIFIADWNNVPALETENNAVLIVAQRDKFLKLIREAHKEIKIYAQNIDDYQIVGALANAAKHGIAINILTSAKISKGKAAYLTRAGVNIRILRELYIHAKVMIIDQRKAVIGSTNLTKSSFEDNRELAVITEDSMVIKQLIRTFNHDWELEYN